MGSNILVWQMERKRVGAPADFLGPKSHTLPSRLSQRPLAEGGSPSGYESQNFLIVFFTRHPLLSPFPMLDIYCVRIERMPRACVSTSSTTLSSHSVLLL